MTFEIRQAEATDARIVAQLNEIVQAPHHERYPEIFCPPDWEALAPIVETWLSSDHYSGFIAEDPAPCGYALALTYDRPETVLQRSTRVVVLEHLAVDASARRRGIARALVESVLKWADGLGADSVELSTWAFNDEAQDLFESMGFTVTTRHLRRAL